MKPLKIVPHETVGVDCADTVSAYSQQLHGRNIDYADTVSAYSQQLHGRNIDNADTPPIHYIIHNINNINNQPRGLPKDKFLCPLKEQ